VIVGAGTLGIFACLGFGRFALGMLLPSMASSLGLTYTEMGLVSTGNFIGYLAGVLFSGVWAIRIGARRLIFAALLTVSATMVLSSRAQGFLYLLVVYALTGVGSGASNVPIMALVSSWFASRIRGRAAGFVVIGSGFAIIFAGKFIPFVNQMQGPEGWRTSWLILGSITAVVALICFVLIRDRPEEKGLESIGTGDAAGGNRVSGGFAAYVEENIYRRGLIYHLGSIYFLFGYTYVIYATFVVTALVKERGFTEAAAGDLWSLVGFLSLFSGPVFGTLSDKIGRKAGLIVVFAFQMTSYLLMACCMPGVYLYLSIALYGIVAWSIPSIMAATVGDHFGPRQAARAFGFVTFIFGFGQITGPAIAGVLAERTDSFTSSFFMAAGFAALAIVLTLFLRRPYAVTRS
jgi:MFS family permease